MYPVYWLPYISWTTPQLCESAIGLQILTSSNSSMDWYQEPGHVYPTYQQL